MKHDIQTVQSLSSQAESKRSRSSLRLKYQAEVEVIRKSLGDLESIRAQLGLSRRKICQLLLVDPSAWTRWVREPDRVPPHIYQALRWYIYWRETQSGQMDLSLSKALNLNDQKLEAYIRELNTKIDRAIEDSSSPPGTRSFLWQGLTALNTALFILLLGYLILGT